MLRLACRLLLEEALATVGSRVVEMTTSTGYVTPGLQQTDEFCGVAVGAEGFPFLVLFHQMEPDARQGSIHVALERGQQGRSSWRLDQMDLPSDIVQCKVLLFSPMVNTGGGECRAIETLCSLRVQESSITLLSILCSTDSLVAICDRYPGKYIAPEGGFLSVVSHVFGRVINSGVHIITSGIDSKIDPETQAIIPGVGDFVARYNGV
ncbi:unnamed protein product [Phytophthora fragariaefolia]|uniref:Unnamed protein product n=1 Tax=Phytophthora fragariaefolia TaxID=1490495 RepID=A0A9W7D184_9STRA|nr:unnamed protein product [Phytophthora fragariaefolia]